MVRVFLILGKQQSTFLSPINDFGRKNLQSSQVLAVLSDIFKILREEIFIPSDEKEISWDGIFKISHKIVRMSRRFFASKHKHPKNELISCDFIKKLRFSKARRIAYFRPVFLSLGFSC